MDNATDYDSFVNFGKNFVIMAWDEYNAPQQNWPELVLRYWRVVDDKLGGKKKLSRQPVAQIKCTRRGKSTLTTK